MKTLKKLGYISVEVILICSILIIGGISMITKFIRFTDDRGEDALNYTNNVVNRFIGDDEAWRDGDY